MIYVFQVGERVTLPHGTVEVCASSKDRPYFWSDLVELQSNQMGGQMDYRALVEDSGIPVAVISYFPVFYNLTDLTKFLIHMGAKVPESTPAPTIKPKRAPRRKEGIPESTYRWRKRSAHVDSLVGQIGELRDLLQTADYTIQDLNAQVAEGRQWRTRYQELSKGTEARIEHLEGQVANLAYTIEEMGSERVTICKQLADKDVTINGMDAITQRQNATINEQGEMIRSLTETKTQLLNENAQARRDAWGATYKLELLLAQPWKSLVPLLTKRKG